MKINKKAHTMVDSKHCSFCNRTFMKDSYSEIGEFCDGECYDQQCKEDSNFYCSSEFNECKPCPFCGSQQLTSVLNGGYGISCLCCGAEGPKEFDYNYITKNEFQQRMPYVIRKWNNLKR